MLKPVKFANAVILVSIVLQLIYYFVYVGVVQDYVGSVLLNILITTKLLFGFSCLPLFGFITAGINKTRK